MLVLAAVDTKQMIALNTDINTKTMMVMPIFFKTLQAFNKLQLGKYNIFIYHHLTVVMKL